MGNIGKSANIDIHGVTLTHETTVMCGVRNFGVWATSVHDDLCAHWDISPHHKLPLIVMYSKLSELETLYFLFVASVPSHRHKSTKNKRCQVVLIKPLR